LAKIKVNDIDIYYECRGSGFPLVMIMGLSANANWWPPPLIDSLAQTYKVLIFDNRGAGRTDAPMQDYSMPMFAGDTVGLMKALGMDRAHVFGVSMGGLIAQEISLLYPERVEKLVLGCTHCGVRHSIPTSFEVMRHLAKQDFKSTDERFHHTLSVLFPRDFIEQNPEKIEDLKRRYQVAPRAAQNQQFAAIMGFDSFDRLDMIKVPTLVLSGDQDVLIPPGNAEILAKKIPGARLMVLKGCGHSFVNQVPEKVFKILREFLG